MENKYFRNILLLAICIICLSPIFFSCISDSKLKRLAYERGICPTAKDSIRIKDSVAIKYKTKEINEPSKDGGDVIINFGENCDSIKMAFEMLKKNPIIHKQNGITETINVEGNKIKIDCKEDAYKLKLDSAYERIEIYKSRWEELVKVEKPVCNLPHRNWVDQVGRWSLIINLVSLIIIFLYFYFRLKKG